MSTLTTKVNGKNVEQKYTYKNRILWRVTHNGFTYTLDRDAFGNMTKTRVGTATLADYTYNNYSGKLNGVAYGNGDTVRYVYDEYDRLI